MGYRIEIDVDECMSSGKCVADFPQGFAFDGDELATLVDGGSALSVDEALRAARNCPSRAIRLFDAETGGPVVT